MFTGLIEEIGKIAQLRPLGAKQLRLELHCSRVQEGMKLGDSLAVDGVCLTVVAFDSQSVALELSRETHDQSLFSQKRPGAAVNLERALRLGDRLGGHIVQGHVDAKGQLLRRQQEGNFYSLTLSAPPEIARYLVPKGSVAVNGISLTLAEREQSDFTLAIIPHTYQATNLKELQIGDWVHLESDILGRYVEALLHPEAASQSKLTLAFLQEHGFG